MAWLCTRKVIGPWQILVMTVHSCRDHAAAPWACGTVSTRVHHSARPWPQCQCRFPANNPTLCTCVSLRVVPQAGGLRSLVWPGAVCGARGGDWTCCYVGWGVKNAPFVPVPPPPVTAEFDQSQVGRGGTDWIDVALLTRCLDATPSPAAPSPYAVWSERFCQQHLDTRIHGGLTGPWTTNAPCRWRPRSWSPSRCPRPRRRRSRRTRRGREGY